jgi:GNAT superfamily N-acetyltransferase
MPQPRLRVRLIRHFEPQLLERFLEVYARSFNPDERVSTNILREVMRPSPDRMNPVHLFAGLEGRQIVGGAVVLVVTPFDVLFGSYVFVDPAERGRKIGIRILRDVLAQERDGPKGAIGAGKTTGRIFRLYGEVTASSGPGWHQALEGLGFRFFPAMWPLGSYADPDKVIPGQLCYFPYRRPPSRFSQAAMLTYVHALFYGPNATHRHLVPRLVDFVDLEAPEKE